MAPGTPSSKTNNASWAATFPANTDSSADSMLFMKRMLYVSFTQLYFFRQLLPEICFKKRRLENQRLFLFNTLSDDALNIGNQLRSVCDTMAKGYLRELHLLIGDESKGEEEIIEVYKMGVTYSTDKPSITLSSGSMEPLEIQYAGVEHAKQQTCDLLKRIRQITERLAELPEDCFHKLYILYDDEKTPKGYQARLFNREPDPYVISPDAQRLAIGDVHVKHHACQFEVSSVFIKDPVEFELDMDGYLSAIKDQIRKDLAAGETTLVGASLDSTSGSMPEETLPEEEVHKEQSTKSVDEPRHEVSGVKDLEKKLAETKIKEKTYGVSSSSEEKDEASKDPNTRKTGVKTVSPKKILNKSKVIKKTPGIANKRSRSRLTRA